jgi:hypothetical protein
MWPARRVHPVWPVAIAAVSVAAVAFLYQRRDVPLHHTKTPFRSTEFLRWRLLEAGEPRLGDADGGEVRHVRTAHSLADGVPAAGLALRLDRDLAIGYGASVSILAC